MKKSRLVFGSMIVFVFCISIIFGRSDSERSPASALSQNNNMKILAAIPLVKNTEKRVKNEDEITVKLIDLFDSFVDRNRKSDGSLMRGTHAKGQCFKGVMEIFPTSYLVNQFGLSEDLAQRMKRGLWSHDGNWPVSMRFANANGMGKVQSDKEPDVRGFSFSVFGPRSIPSYGEPGRQDFMMNSTPQFASGEIKEFFEVVKAANIFVYGDFSYAVDPRYLLDVKNALSLIAQGNENGSRLKSLAHLNYWANLPYTHGLTKDGEPQDIVKYKAVPCDGKDKQVLSSLDGLSDNYLQEEIVRAADAGDVCMFIQMQFMNIEALNKTRSTFHNAINKWDRSDWVENGGLLWDESSMPFYTIGRVTIPKEDGSSAHISCDDQYINTRLYSNPENQPVGSIARVRTYVEENSRSRRMKN